MARSAFEAPRKLARLSAELIRHRSSMAPSIAAKAVIARGVWGIETTRFLMSGLYNQRMSRWPESMGYLMELEPGLRTINWQQNGKNLTVDKLITAERFANVGIPSAPLIAVVGRDCNAHPCEGLFPNLTTVEEVARTLAAAPDHLFAKPATGWRGDGVMGPERHANGWNLDGASLSDLELAQRLLKAAPPAGLLLQARVRSHAGLTPIGGNLGLGTVRINTALTEDGAEVLFAFAKIMGSKCLVDNFSGGKFGNMLASVDKESGRITQVFGRRPGQQYLMEQVTVHPITGTPLIGFQLPLWNDAIALAKRVASSFPEAPLVGSDVALTDDGPLIIEVQSDWDANAPQLLMGQGLRPILRKLVPRLALSEQLKQEAMLRMGLSGESRKPKRSQRQARI